MMRKRLFTLALVGGLAACATQAQRQFEAIATTDKAATERIKACVAAIYYSPEAAVLRPHVPLKPSDATLAQISDSSRASDQEINAILVTHPRVQECRKAYLAEISQPMPSLVPIYISFYNKSEDNLLALIQKQLTWGEFTRRQRDVSTDSLAATQAEAERIVTGLQEDHEAELARRQRAAEATARWAQTQQIINAMNRPTPYVMQPTISPIINCTSSQIGSQVFTNCR